VPECDRSALAATYRELVRRTEADFGRYRITLGYPPPNYELLGKFAGWTLGYTARTGRMNELETLLNFVSEYTRKPRDLWPECWLLKADWLDRTDPHRDMPWVNFTNDPDGDYTMDSGNCEQLVLSMEHLVRHVLGVDLRNGKPGIHPALPIGWGEVKVDGLLLPDGTGRASRIGYRYRAVDTGAVLKLNSLPDGELEVSVPAPNDRSYRIYLDGRQIKALRTEPGIEVDRAVCAVRNQTSLKLEITYGNH